MDVLAEINKGACLFYSISTGYQLVYSYGNRVGCNLGDVYPLISSGLISIYSYYDEETIYNL